MWQSAADVVKQEDPGLEVVAATLTEDEATFTEVLLTGRGCQNEPCCLILTSDPVFAQDGTRVVCRRASRTAASARVVYTGAVPELFRRSITVPMTAAGSVVAIGPVERWRTSRASTMKMTSSAIFVAWSPTRSK